MTGFRFPRPFRALLIAALATALALAFPFTASATVTASTATSYDGSYTVSWTDVPGADQKLYLFESFNAGAWTSVLVSGNSSRSYTGKAVGTWAYQLKVYVLDAETQKYLPSYTAGAATVLVAPQPAPGAPGFITGPFEKGSGSAYTLSWTAAAGVVTRYELQENGLAAYSGASLSATLSGRSDGTYAYRVRACNTSGCGPFSPDHPVAVGGTLTTQVAGATPPPPPVVPAQGWVGTISGTPSVDGGAAAYRIEVEVPPGRAGMQPEVALAYSSRNGNSIAGVGWSLSAGGSIYRCPRTLAHDGGNRPVRLDGDDKLCMNGQRLVLVAGGYGQAGSEYRTEIDGFDRVRLANGGMGDWGAYFTVEHKSGRVSHFAPVGSRPGAVPGAWRLVREFDPQGNCIRYDYSRWSSRGPDEEWLLSAISYTGTGSGTTCADGAVPRVVELVYEGRADVRTTYQAGAGSMMTARLAAIATRVGSQPVRRYQLAYSASAATQRSLLRSVTLCAGATCGAERLPATTFTYQEDVPTFAGESLAAGAGKRVSFLGDFDGDGLPDSVLLTTAASHSSLVPPPYAPESVTLSCFGQSATSTPAALDVGIMDPSEQDRTLEGPAEKIDRAHLDANGDGRLDLMGVHNGKVAFAALKCSGGVAAGQSWNDTNLPAPGGVTSGMFFYAPYDYDGDGLVDLSLPDGLHLKTRLDDPYYDPLPAVISTPQQPAGYLLTQSDLNGDGTADAFYDGKKRTDGVTPSISFLVKTSSGLSYQSWTLGALGGPSDSFANQGNELRRWIDVNGDGLQDIYDPRSNQVYVNRGGPPRGGMFQAVAFTDLDPAHTVLLRGGKAFAMDVDGDSLEELVVPTVRPAGAQSFCVRNTSSMSDPRAPEYYCGDEIDYWAPDGPDRSLFHWSAYKLREKADGTFELSQVIGCSLVAPIGAAAPGPDYSGDGLPDLRYTLYNTINYNNGTLIDGYPANFLGAYGAKSQARAPDLLIGATNGLGATASWTHQPLSRRAAPSGCDPVQPFYAAHHDDAHSPGYVFFTSSMWAVSKYEVSNGLGAATNATCYRYEDAMLSNRGRGFQGFKKIVAEERLAPAAGEPNGVAGSCPSGLGCSANNLRTTTEFHQEFPLTNRVKRVAVEQTNGGALLSESTTTWQATATLAATASPVGMPITPGVWIVSPTVTVAKKYLPGAAGPAVVTTTSVDVFDPVLGEATQSCTVVDDAYRHTLSLETRTFTSMTDSTVWWPARLDSRVQVKGLLDTSFNRPASPPYACPTLASAAETSSKKTATINYLWYAANATAGLRRKLQSETLTAGATVQSTVIYTYDPSGNLATKQVTARDIGPITDPSGKSTVLPASAYTYTADGYFLATETNPVGHVATTVTDAASGRVTAHQAVQGGPWTRMAHDALGRPFSTAVDGGQPAFEVLGPAPGGSDAVVTRTVNQAGAPARVEFIDRLGRVIATETEGLGSGDYVTAQVTYNARGAKIIEYAPRYGRYDPWNVAPSPYHTSYSTFDALGRAGRKEVVRDPALFAPGRGEPTQITTYVHDGFKTTIRALKPAAQGGALDMSRTYDGRGWLVETTQVDSGTPPATITTRYDYDAAGSLTAITDTKSNVLSARYDDLGHKVSVSDPDRGNWTYTWDGLGRLRAQTDARGNLLQQEYDAAGRPTLRHLTAPGGPRILDAEWHYDANGQKGLLSQVKGTAAGTTGDFQRDYQYDVLLRPSKVTTRVGARDALMQSGTRTFAVEYGYDESYGRLKATRYPSLIAGGGAMVAYEYGARGHPVGESEVLASGLRGKRYRTATLLSPRGQVLHQILGNGVDEAMTYDAAAGLMLSVESTRPAGQPPIRSTHYWYDHFLNLVEQNKTFCRRDAAGTCLKKADGSPDTAASNETFIYDDLQRITSATLVGAAAGSASYLYDTLGNITSKSDYGTPYLYGSNARATRNAGPHAVLQVTRTGGAIVNFSYDLNGNMVGMGPGDTGAGDSRSVEFDAMDRAVRVCTGQQLPCPAGAVTTDFAYAPDGARYRQRITGPVASTFGPKTVYAVDKDYELVVWDDLAKGTEERSYLGGSVVVYRAGAQSPEVRYQHLDRLGSVDAVTKGDSGASVLFADLHGYDPFGKPRGETWTPSAERLHPSGDFGATTDRGFTGHEHLDVHYLIHMNGRVYDYRIGRFLSVDPIISNPLNSQSLNPYSYIGNNPLSGTDPTGYAPEPVANDTNGSLDDQERLGLGSVQGTNGARPDVGKDVPASDVGNAADTAKDSKSVVEAVLKWVAEKRAEWKAAFEDAGRRFADSLNFRRLQRNEVEAETAKESAQQADALGAQMGRGAYDATEAVAKEGALLVTGSVASKGVVTITKRGLAHVLERHVAGGALSAGKSLFAAGEDIQALVRAADGVAAVAQRNGNFVRTIDAGRVIGVDRATGQVTSLYTVVSNKVGELVTAFPGTP